MKWKFLVGAAALVGALAAQVQSAEAQWREARDYGPRWGERTASAAHLLSEQARHFAVMVQGMDGYSHLSDDAYALASSAEHLHQVVEGLDGPRHVRDDFRSVEHDFRHLRAQLDRAHHVHHAHHLQDDWHRLTQAYLVVSHQLDVGHHRGYSRTGHRYYDAPPRRHRGRVYRYQSSRVRVVPAPGARYRYQRR